MEQVEFEATGVALICGDVYEHHPFIPLGWWYKRALLPSDDSCS